MASESQIADEYPEKDGQSRDCPEEPARKSAEGERQSRSEAHRIQGDASFPDASDLGDCQRANFREAHHFVVAVVRKTEGKARTKGKDLLEPTPPAFIQV